MQLFSSDGSYVVDVSLDEEGDLFIYPVQEGYGNIYPEAAFLRVIIPGLSEPPVRTLRATIPGNESQLKFLILDD